MRLRPWTIRPLAFAISVVIRAWMRPAQFTFTCDDPISDPRNAQSNGIYLCWHEMMLFPISSHRGHAFTTLASRHRDGELITRTLNYLGYSVVRGSSSKEGASALRGLMREGKLKNLAITPDGPKGPRRGAQPRALHLPSRTGMPIHPAGFAFSECWRIKSWDRMAIPKPWATGQCVVARPIFIPPNIQRDQIETYRQQVQDAMDEAQSRAEALTLPNAARP